MDQFHKDKIYELKKESSSRQILLQRKQRNQIVREGKVCGKLDNVLRK
jgi:hypothetical protein